VKRNQNNVKIGSTTITRQSTKSKQRGRFQSKQQQAANESLQTSNQAKLIQQTRSPKQKGKIRSTKLTRECFNF